MLLSNIYDNSQLLSLTIEKGFIHSLFEDSILELITLTVDFVVLSFLLHTFWIQLLLLSLHALRVNDDAPVILVFDHGLIKNIQRCLPCFVMSLMKVGLSVVTASNLVLQWPSMWVDSGSSVLKTNK